MCVDSLKGVVLNSLTALNKFYGCILHMCYSFPTFERHLFVCDICTLSSVETYVTEKDNYTLESTIDGSSVT